LADIREWSVLSPQRGGSKLKHMRRGTLVLASSLAAAVVAGAFIYLRSQPPSSPVEAGESSTATAQPQPTSPVDVEQSASADASKGAARNQQPPSSNVNDEIRRQRMPKLDEATLREQDRKAALNDTVIGYWLLVEDLDLPKQEAKDLLVLLAEMQTERGWTSYQQGRTISAQERSDRIAAVIGQEKLEQFLALEKNGAAYWETYQIALLLQRRGVPTTPAQRDGVFDILVEVHERYPVTPPADLDTHSVEYIDDHLRQLDEFDRHVIELAPSVLSPNQVARLYERYQGMSRERITSVEMQKSGKFKVLGEGLGWMTPARWNPE
jgi:hypothetical protein